MSRPLALSISVVLVIAVMAVIFFFPRHSQAPTQNTNTATNTTQVTNTTTNTSTAAGIAFSTNDEPDSLAHFRFATRLPQGWISQYDSTNSMLLFSPLSAGQSDSGDTIVAVTRLTGSTWPTVSGGSVTTTNIDGYAVQEWSGLTVTSAWHDRFDGWHRGEMMRQADWRVVSGAKGVYYRFTGGPGVTDADWKLLIHHLQYSS